MTKMICPKCKYDWDYQGDKKPITNIGVYLSCPRCRHNIKLEVKNEHETKN